MMCFAKGQNIQTILQLENGVAVFVRELSGQSVGLRIALGGLFVIERGGDKWLFGQKGFKEKITAILHRKLLIDIITLL